MEFKLPTREEAKAITENSEAFYVTETRVEGYNVELYDYRLASISDFVDNNAFELRGLCFVETETGVWERNILMNKFFNVNQTIGWMYEDVKDKKVVRVQDKLDGSIISFVKFPNGTVRAKSKMSFTSDQALMAQGIYDINKPIRSLVETAMNDGYVPIFELVSPDNQIVLEYDNTDLVLLQMRKISDGSYASKELMKSYLKLWDLKGSQEYWLLDERSDAYMDPLEWLLNEKPTKEGIEGWIVTFEDGQMAKIKTDWYIQLHGLIGPDAFRENLLVQTILEGNIDDVISQLAEGAKKERVIELSEKVQHDFNHKVVEYKKLRGEYFNVFTEDRKKFALQYSPGGKTPHYLFGFVMKNLHGKLQDVEKIAEGVAKDYILKRCSSLSDAKKYIESIEGEK